MADVVYPGDTPGGTLGTGLMPGNYDLVIYRGDYLPINLTFKNPAGTVLDLTGYTGKAVIRADYTTTTVYAFTVTGSGLNGALGTDGRVNLVLPSSVSSTIPAGDYIWDVQLTDASGNNRTYIAGDVRVVDEVTK